MISVSIEDKTELKKPICPELSENPDVEQVQDFPEDFEIPLDENGVPIGIPWEEIMEEMEVELSETTGVDFRKIREMEEAGLLDLDKATNEMLLSPEFKYEPYPGFKPKLNSIAEP
jgi:hypothetical protein